MFSLYVYKNKMATRISILLSFILGITLPLMLLSRSSYSPVPSGVWVNLYSAEFISLTLNLSNSEIGDNQITTWIREDRKEPFSGSTGVIGNVIISKVTFDCDNQKVAIHEQRSFNADMQYISSLEGESVLVFPEELSTKLSAKIICNAVEKEKLITV